ncbi:hypothetical protein [Actinophytocola gossypii]|uniref:Uncharacterized protein n=1 Tax=Actinophytocola gossypii TaxID=2812003 RepID=A0ABT2JBU2_9PSEU|nr:hypothetical protein [Actinophytocola gossypii]MCT2585330.1 hypothetical protein [Actinophytocola gossypii]
MRSPIFGQLETSLAEYLVDVARGASHGDDRTVARMARHELPRLVEALRAVLDEHAPDEYGRCPNCRASRFGRTPAPCRAYLSAHLCLVAPDDEQPAPVERTAPIRRPVVLADPRGLMRAPG